eukprot:4220845-Pyramimonas_sp.AAC.2
MSLRADETCKTAAPPARDLGAVLRDCPLGVQTLVCLLAVRARRHGRSASERGWRCENGLAARVICQGVLAQWCSPQCDGAR